MYLHIVVSAPAQTAHTRNINQTGLLTDMALGFGQTVYHWACWKSVGSPTEYKGESGYAEDQGYFFDDGDHDLKEPKIPHKFK